MAIYNSNSIELPEHEPIERSVKRIDGGFVLVGGWQIKYDPAPGRVKELYQLLPQREAEMEARAELRRAEAEAKRCR